MRFHVPALPAAAIAVSIAWAKTARAQAPEPLTPTPLPWVSSALALDGPARPGAFLGVEGRRAAALGVETGALEVWAWPLKLVRDLTLSFQLPLYAEPIPAAAVTRHVEMTPAGATIVYTHSAFTVRERIFVPTDEPAVVIVLEVEAVRPMEIVVSFHGDLQLAWPGGIGGQYLLWNDTTRAFELTESRREVNAVVGSPYATRATTNPTWSVPDAPSQMRIAVGDQTPVPMPRWQEPAGRLVNVVAHGIPIVLVGQIAPRDSVLATYRRVLAHLPALYAGRVAHADSVLAGTVGFGDSAVDRKARWAELNLDEALVCNPDLGCGPVAGYGAAGAGSYRPGFAWFFGGDAAINSLALSSAGAFDLARRFLRFFASYQRADGKITHEISQSAARIPWFTAYPFPYWHGDTTPFWLLAVGELFRASADTAFVRSLWPNLARAYRWCVGTVGADGLMQNPLAGVGAIEVGHLGVGIQTDIYLAGVWVEALGRTVEMAEAVGDTAVATGARHLRLRARGSLEERFWMPRAGRFAFAVLVGDSLNDNLTVWPATAMSWHLFDEERGQAMAAELARATISTDWGARTLASESPLYDPLHYNNGTVWPFVTGFLALAEYRYHNPYAGRALLDAVGRTFDVWGLGRNPEVFSGASFEPLETAVPQQFFSTSMFLTPLLRGAYGLEPDAPHHVLTLAPHLFDRPGTYQIRGVRVGDATLDVRYEVGEEGLGVTVHRLDASDASLTLHFEPAIAPGAQVRAVEAGGQPVAHHTVSTGRDVHVLFDVPMVRGMHVVRVMVRHTRGWWLELPASEPRRGDRSQALKVLDVRPAGDTLVVRLEGAAGHRYTVTVHGPGGLASKEIVAIPADSGDARDGYVRAARRWRMKGG
jgi:glycogen debranching enzyme